MKKHILILLIAGLSSLPIVFSPAVYSAAATAVNQIITDFGTALGGSQTMTSLVAAQKSGFCVTGIATGLTVGTPIWIDVSLVAITAGTATITGSNVISLEV